MAGEGAPESDRKQPYAVYIPMLCYCFRWNIEVSYYEQKTFWSLCSYIVRSQKGNVAYCAMKILPYQEKEFSKYRGESVQKFRFALSMQIRQQIFYANLLRNVETSIKSSVYIKVL